MRIDSFAIGPRPSPAPLRGGDDVDHRRASSRRCDTPQPGALDGAGELRAIRGAHGAPISRRDRAPTRSASTRTAPGTRSCRGPRQDELEGAGARHGRRGGEATVRGALVPGATATVLPAELVPRRGTRCSRRACKRCMREQVDRLRAGADPRDRGGARQAQQRALQQRKELRVEVEPPDERRARMSLGAVMQRSHARLDERVVRDGLAETRTQAQALILAGPRAGGRRARSRRPGTPCATRRACGCAARSALRLARRREARRRARRPRRRSRAAASASTSGASTGGFTDCLLQARRARAWWRSTSATASSTRACATTRASPSSSARNARTSPPADAAAGRSSSSTIDVSFISATLLLPARRRARAARRAPRAREAAVRGRAASRWGRAAWCATTRSAPAAVEPRPAGGRGARLRGRAARPRAGSPGPKGNREIFLLARPAGRRGPDWYGFDSALS